MQRNILILGGSGFVSGALAKALIIAGEKVWVLTRGIHDLPHGVISLIADRNCDKEFLKIILQAQTRWDVIYDCIGYNPIQVQGNLSFLSDLAKHYVFISTDFVYDHILRKVPQNEDAEDYSKTGYGLLKRQCELVIMAQCANILPWTIFRPCHVYGPGSLLGCYPSHVRDPGLINTLQCNLPLSLVAGGHYLQQPIFINDFIQILLSVLWNPRVRNEIFCVAGPDIIESLYYYEAISSVLGCQVKIINIPKKVYLLKKPEDFPFFCNRVYDLKKLIKHQLPFPKTSFKTGLKLHIENLQKGMTQKLESY
jgi:nucleoside-diphosphate-sugar epimerase